MPRNILQIKAGRDQEALLGMGAVFIVPSFEKAARLWQTATSSQPAMYSNKTQQATKLCHRLAKWP